MFCRYKWIFHDISWYFQKKFMMGSSQIWLCTWQWRPVQVLKSEQDTDLLHTGRIAEVQHWPKKDYCSASYRYSYVTAMCMYTVYVCIFIYTVYLYLYIYLYIYIRMLHGSGHGPTLRTSWWRIQAEHSKCLKAMLEMCCCFHQPGTTRFSPSAERVSGLNRMTCESVWKLWAF
jgi:hypothetical protein